MPEPVAEDCQQQVERGEEDEDLHGGVDKHVH